MEKSKAKTGEIIEVVDGPSNVIKLDFPFDYGTERIEKIVFREFVGEHIMHLSGTSTMQDMVKVAAKNTTLSESVFRKMNSKDLKRVLDYVGEHV